MKPAELRAPEWRRSTRSGVNGNCVEVAYHGSAVAVRDSKHSTGPALIFTASEWQRFIDEAKRGNFDV